jgi:hypothetical protein
VQPLTMLPSSHSSSLPLPLSPSTQSRRRRGIGSTAPSALLCDAHSAYSDGDAKCDDIIRELSGSNSGSSSGGDSAEEAGSSSALSSVPHFGASQLHEAVSGCLSGALAEWEPDAQRTLLRAAAYGKAFEPSCVGRDALGSTARTLRLLNALRDSDTALPLSAAQYAALGHRRVIARLLARHQFRMVRRQAQP